MLIPAVVPQNGKNNMFSKGLPGLLGTAALVLWGEGEQAGLVQLEKRRDWPSGDLATACLHLQELTGRTTRLFTTLHGAMGVNWDKRFRLDIRRNLFQWGQSGSRTSCPEWLCCLLPLQFSRLSLATWPCSEQQVGLEASSAALHSELSYNITNKSEFSSQILLHALHR